MIRGKWGVRPMLITAMKAERGPGWLGVDGNCTRICMVIGGTLEERRERTPSPLNEKVPCSLKPLYCCAYFWACVILARIVALHFGRA